MGDTPDRVTKRGHKVNARPDTMDFRDRMFVPTLVEVGTKIELKKYREFKVPILDQGTEGACTGYGLATVVNYLLRRRKVVPDNTPVSPTMLYHLARRYDEWPGEDYEGSDARGAMKGWHKHGVCSQELWKEVKRVTPKIAKDAASRPLGAYFRVNHKDLVAMHCAIAEVGILYATAIVHEGWDDVKPDGTIPQNDRPLGGHAFAIVAYDERGFWIQNSWGDDWGFEGFAHLSYDDWLLCGTDVWVARLGAPAIVKTPASVASRHSATTTYTDAQSYYELRRHIVSLGNNGLLNPNGTYGSGEKDVEHIFTDHIPSLTKKWKKRRILLYAHGGLVDEDSAVQRVAEYLPSLLKAEVYPISFIWHSDYWSTLRYMLEDAVRRRKPEGFIDQAKDFMLDRLDDALEPIARKLTGKAQWDEMKENSQGASADKLGGVRKVIEHLDRFLKDDPTAEVHILGHSAGSIFHAPLVELLTSQYKRSIKTCTLWAPACTVKLFKEYYMPSICNGKIGRFALFTLNDKTEQDDNCAKIYNKSLLYLVSNAFEEEPRIPLFRDGEPILGMEKFIRKDQDLKKLFKSRTAEWIISPNSNAAEPEHYSLARHHGDFDDDEPTVQATLARILGKETDATFEFNYSTSALREKRLKL